MNISGSVRPQVLDGEASDSPMLFVEKQIIAVAIADGFMEGAAGIPHSCCEVYAPSEHMTNVSGTCVELAAYTMQLLGNFVGSAQHTTFIAGDTISVLTGNADNYYHFMAEFVPRYVRGRRTWP